MRVVMDEQIFAIQHYGGISRMFAELARQFVVHSVADVDLAAISAPVVNRYLLDDPEVAAALQVTEARNQWTALARYFSRLSVRTRGDVVHNTFYLPHGLTPMREAKRVVTVHDMIPELLPQTRRRLDWLTLKKQYVSKADHVICVSEATRQDLVRVYPDVVAPISVVHHGVDERFHPGVPRLDFLPDRYVLFVGKRDQYKDSDIAFRAFAQIAQLDPDLHLLCVGGAGLTPQEVARLTELGVRPRVSQRFLTDTDMASAYAHAQVFMFPSRFEGFGLPALESMACGTPVVLARSTSLPEVGGDAALYFEVGDAAGLADQVTRLLTDAQLAEQQRAAGLARAAQFTWADSAARTADVYRSLLG